MGFLRKLKAKYHHKVERKYLSMTKRRQFNLTIDEKIIETVKLLAIALEVPRYVIAEHLLQVGAYHVIKVIKDSENRDKLQEHLVKAHLLGKELDQLREWDGIIDEF